jgi:hypothetical protein
MTDYDNIKRFDHQQFALDKNKEELYGRPKTISLSVIKSHY